LFDLPFTLISSSKLKDLKQALEKAALRSDQMRASFETQQGLSAAVLLSINEGVLAVDKNGRIILANPAIEKTFGVIETEILGHTVREAMRNNEIADLIEEAAGSGRSIEKEINIVTPIERSFVALASFLKSESSDFGVVCVLHDITELRKLEQYRSEFVANISHELKTPLTAIRNYVETLLSGALNDPAHNLEFLRKIDKHAINLTALIEDILEMSELESKKELGVFTQFDILSAVHRAVETISSKAFKKGIKIDLNCTKEPILVSGLEEHVYRAVLNLLDNAVNYTNSGGKITVSGIKEADKIIISVSDTGIGIPEEYLPRLFERFYRADKARSRELGGTGLGLAIVKHVMNVHNGSVLVESTEGHGSKFNLVFPVI
jgi:two-component system phosphate regulon sensor histidine kinase PhoR